LIGAAYSLKLGKKINLLHQFALGPFAASNPSFEIQADRTSKMFVPNLRMLPLFKMFTQTSLLLKSGFLAYIDFE